MLVAALLATPHIGPAAGVQEVLPWWSGVALALYAAIDEELMFRFGVMTLVVWFIAHLLPGEDGAPNVYGWWFAVALSALIFELAHVAPLGVPDPAVAAAETSLQAVRIAVGGLLGWLYWRRGLESAVVAHLTYDLTLFYGIVLVI